MSDPRQFSSIPADQLERLRSLLADDETSLGEIVTEIAQDEGLAELFILSVNSVEFGLKHQVRDLAHAVSILGVRGVAMLLDRGLRIDAGHTVRPPHTSSPASDSARSKRPRSVDPS